MNRKITPTRYFNKLINSFFNKRKLLQEDFENFKEDLKKYPEIGDVVPGLNGIRKIRIKSINKGKSAGHRICYYYFKKNEEVFLLLIYAKNKQENMSTENKKILKTFVDIIKKEGKLYE